MTKAYILLAEGFEEVEALTPADYLRRAGIDVKLVSMTGHALVRGARGISVQADMAFPDIPADLDCLILPGGMPGSRNLAARPEVVDIVRKNFAAGKLIAAICAAPALVLGKAAGILKGRRFTCYPGEEANAGPGGSFVESRVVEDGNLITSRAAGTAGEFSLAIVAALAGKAAAEKLRQGVMLGDKA
jgi:4-methyl-5(b-hydroxyethyl)-thiazole monophosphate biosynthesis